MFFAKTNLRLRKFYRSPPSFVVRNIPQARWAWSQPQAEPASRGRRNFCRWSKNILVPSDNRRWASRGQTLVELMVAMSVVTIGLLGVFAVLSQSLGLNRIVANQYTAAGLAAEGIEVVKNIADSSVVAGQPWNAGLSVDGQFGVEYKSRVLDKNLADRKLKFDPFTGIYSYGSGDETHFRRIITLKNVSVNEIRVNSKVEWTDRGGRQFVVDLEDRLFDWHER